MKTNAFTLAEVLITLGVIGVVAVMTLPTVISNFKKHTVETRLKNQVALIQNAIRMAEAKHGSSTEWDVCDDSFECTKSRFEKYLAPELKVIKICDHDNFEECWTEPSSLTGQKGYLKPDWDIALSAILYNGTSLYLWSGENGNQMQIWFDIDGPNKGKAMLGGDVFGGVTSMARASIYSLPNPNPNNANDARYYCSTEVSTQYAGRYCGYEIQANSWKIPKDYPVRF